MTRAPFIVFEGIEGSGKSTQARNLSRHLREIGRKSVLTKEPGGTPLSNRIRAILLDPAEEGMDPLTELLLYAASRRQHVVDVIRPSVEHDAVVLCDRFTDATLAYQGYGRGLNLDRLREINNWVTDGLVPDLTVILDLPEDVGLSRARDRNRNQDLQLESRLEGEDLRFHRRVREGYLSLAEESPERYGLVSADGDADEVFARVIDLISKRTPDVFTVHASNGASS
ncbi:MAG: dTMP kinase [Acidobacteria bacterium]|nr:dTMP kinase [Acidobacteriota bacterium]